MGHVDDAPAVEFLDGAADAGADEDLPPRPPTRNRRRWLMAGALVAVAATAVVVRAAADRPHPAPARTAAVDSFTVLGPGGVYTEVPYVAAARPTPGDVGRLRDCAVGATCYVRRTLPAGTSAALRRVFPDMRIESAWSVVVVRQGPARPELQSREIFAQAGSRSLEVEIRPVVRADAAVRIHQAGVEGTRSVWASVIGAHLVQVIAFERYESTGGVLDQLGTLVRGGQLLDAR